MGERRDTSAYQIRIEGHLDSSWSTWLGGIAIRPQRGGETLLCTSPADQAALHVLLERLRDMGLVLISVECVSDGQPPGGQAPPGGTPYRGKRTTGEGDRDHKR